LLSKSTEEAVVASFRRDRPTWLSYSAIGVYAFDLYAFGPALALLRPELHLSYAMVGVHSAAWALGTIAASVGYNRAVGLAGRRRLFWWSSLALGTGSIIFALAYTVALSLLGAVIMGGAGTLLLTAAQAVLSDRHGRRREQALVEANIGAGACGVVAPLLLAALGHTAATWRVAMILPVIAMTAVWLMYRSVTLPDVPPATAPPGPSPIPDPSPLSATYWILAVLVALGIGVEFCLIYFGAELLVHSEHLSTTDAGAALSLFYAGLLVGRMIGGRLTRRPGQAEALILLSLAVVAVGFAVLWLVPVLIPALVGLFVTGLGVANLYPLSSALALAAAPQHADIANARIQLLGGVVSLTAPLVLGALANVVGLRGAFAVEPLLILASVCALRVGLSKRQESYVVVDGAAPSPTG
jgi:MFS family permease